MDENLCGYANIPRAARAQTGLQAKLCGRQHFAVAAADQVVPHGLRRAPFAGRVDRVGNKVHAAVGEDHEGAPLVNAADGGLPAIAGAVASHFLGHLQRLGNLAAASDVVIVRTVGGEKVRAVVVTTIAVPEQSARAAEPIAQVPRRSLSVSPARNSPTSITLLVPSTMPPISSDMLQPMTPRLVKSFQSPVSAVSSLMLICPFWPLAP